MTGVRVHVPEERSRVAAGGMGEEHPGRVEVMVPDVAEVALVGPENRPAGVRPEKSVEQVAGRVADAALACRRIPRSDDRRGEVREHQAIRGDVGEFLRKRAGDGGSTPAPGAAPRGEAAVAYADIDSAQRDVVNAEVSVGSRHAAGVPDLAQGCCREPTDLIEQARGTGEQGFRDLFVWRRAGLGPRREQQQGRQRSRGRPVRPEPIHALL